MFCLIKIFLRTNHRLGIVFGAQTDTYLISSLPKNKKSMKRLSMRKVSLILAGTFLFSVAMTSCSKDDTPDVDLPDIGGYSSSDSVAAANLLAHWTFDGNANESMSSTAPSTSLRSSFETGIKGQALKLDSGYVLYPTIAALNKTNLGSVTVSTWINTENQGEGSKPTGVFALALEGAAQTDWNSGPVNMSLENGRPKTYNDTLVLKTLFATYPNGARLGGDNINDFGERGTDFQTVLGANKWVNFVMRYDGTGSFLDIYANGVRVSNNKFRFRDNAGVGLGPIVVPGPTQVLIGGFPNNTNGFSASPLQDFQGLYRGLIDEVRVYDKALSDDEISALYELELAGR